MHKTPEARFPFGFHDRLKVFLLLTNSRRTIFGWKELRSAL